MIKFITAPVTIGLLIFSLFLHSTGGASDKADEQLLLAALKKGDHVALIRHALAPGTGDPDNFKLDDCATQRNLSSEGRTQAERIGKIFKEAGLTEIDLYTSQWCRCRETAVLMGVGKPQDLEFLNSFFQNFGRKEQQTEALRSWLLDQPLTEPVVLVTHQVNITAFSGVYPGSGEIIIMRRDENGQFHLAGSISTD